MISDKGLAFIMRHEGLLLHSAQCQAGVWTIGFGHTESVTEGMQISRSTAEVLLIADVKKIEHAIENDIKGMSQNEVDAIISFVFNVGIGAWQTSTMRKLLKKGEPCAKELLKWIYIKGFKSKGLQVRRKHEYILFTEGVYE